MVDGLGRSTLQRGLDEIRVFGFDGWALVVGFVILCVIWGVVLMGSSIMRWPGYWKEPFLAHLLVEIGTDRVPRAADGNRHRAYTFDVPPQSVRSRITIRLAARSRARLAHGKPEYLRHTAICDDPAVVAAIEDWIAHWPYPQRVDAVRDRMSGAKP
jgi:hypothetical protein